MLRPDEPGQVRRVPGELDPRIVNPRRPQVRRRRQHPGTVLDHHVGEGRGVVAGIILDGRRVVAGRGVAVADPHDPTAPDRRFEARQLDLILPAYDAALLNRDAVHRHRKGAPRGAVYQEVFAELERDGGAVADHRGIPVLRDKDRGHSVRACGRRVRHDGLDGARNRPDPVAVRKGRVGERVVMGKDGVGGIIHLVDQGGPEIGGAAVALDPVTLGLEVRRRLPRQVGLVQVSPGRPQVRRPLPEVGAIGYGLIREGRGVVAGIILDGRLIVAARGIAVAHRDGLPVRDHPVQDQADGLCDYQRLGHRDRAAVGGDGEGAGEEAGGRHGRRAPRGMPRFDRDSR